MAEYWKELMLQLQRVLNYYNLALIQLIMICALFLMNFQPVNADINSAAFSPVDLQNQLSDASGGVRKFDFNVQYTNYTRLCHTKQIVTVNGQFPGPILFAREDDRVEVKVSNNLPDKNITIHWHGVRQLRSCWYDGPAYITQCPIRPGTSFVYNFTVTGQRGTLIWHGHISWLRATVHGAIVILPKKSSSNQIYPTFPNPIAEIPLVFGEWWNVDTEAVIRQSLSTGAGPNVSDAFTINGLPGPLYNCSKNDTFKIQVVANQTYLLRLVNAGLNNDLFVSVANHTLTVVEIDATYTKPFTTDTIVITPGQTTNVLLNTKQNAIKGAIFALAIRAYDSAPPNIPFDNTTAIALIQYVDNSTQTKTSKVLMPTLTPYNDTTLANNYSKSLRSLNSAQFPASVPQKVDRHLFFTIGLARKRCPKGQKCSGPSKGKFIAAMNNISFALPKHRDLLQSFFKLQNVDQVHDNNEVHISTTQFDGKHGSKIFPTNFPDKPKKFFNFTSNRVPLKNLTPKIGTHLSKLKYNSSVQLVLQGTSILGSESHPIHLHGFNFYIVGQGNGNYNKTIDPPKFNLVDPPERNTVAVPKAGWVAIRFRADNPGVWFMHCHLEVHTSWGLEMAFVVPNGDGPKNSLQPPPSDLPKC